MASAIITPNVNGGSGSNLRYGPAMYHKFNYFQNAARVGVDALHPNGRNPLFLIRHPGGGTVGSHLWYDTDVGSAAGDDYFYFTQWLLGAHPLSAPATKWDVASVTSGQQQHDLAAFPRTRSLFFPESIIDFQDCIAALMHLSIDLGFDENRVIIGGASMGALLSGLSQLAPGLRGSGNQHVWLKQRYTFDTHRSRAKGIMFHQGPVDFQTYNGVDYYHFFRIGGLAGTRYDIHDEWRDLDPRFKAMFSIIEYIRRRETAGFPPIFISWAEQGNHINPFGDPGVPGSNLHDSRQADDLEFELLQANMPHVKDVHLPGWMKNNNWPGEPNHLALSLYQQRETWMSALVGADN